MRPIDATSPQLIMQHFRPKVQGLQVTANLLKHHVLDFVLVQSSLSSVLGGLGMAAYAAANSYVDAFTVKQNRLNHTRWLSVDWDGWRFGENGKASNVPVGSALADLAITSAEGTIALDRILALDHVSQIIVSTTDLDARLDQWVRPQPVVEEDESVDSASAVALHPRPALETNYVEPHTALERSIVELWQEVLGIGPIGIDDDFFALGGHSLLATQIVSRLRDAHNVSLPLRELFESPTAAGLAKLIEGERRKIGEDDLSRPTPVVRDGALPLSSGQERLWFLDQLEPGSPLYNNFTAVRISGTIDGDIFEQSLQEIIQRHESLRTSFAESQGQAVQIIHDEVDFRLGHIDLSAEPLSSRDEKVRTLALAEARVPFDLSIVPLLRATLLHLDDQQHVLFLTMHHIISDGWSIGVLIQETTAIYEARMAGRPSPLPPLPIQYADYAHWQRQQLAQGVFSDQVDYWKSQLADVPALALPTTYSRPAIQTSNGANIWFELPADVHQDLVALSQKQGATLFMTLLAALATLFHRYTLQDDFAIGSPIANRTDVETEGLIGFLLNTLVLRTDLSGDPTFIEFLERVRQTALDAYAHQDSPFEVLVEALQPERDLSRTPFFQVMFDLQKTQQISLSMPGVAFTPLRIDDGTAKFDMALSMEEGEQYLGGYLNYNTDLFEHAIPSTMLAHLQTLLESIVADPGKRLSELSMLTPDERMKLETWRQIGGEVVVEPLVHRHFEAQADQTPDAVALVWEGKDLTYGELNRRANQVAHRLLELKVGPEQVVGLYFERSVEAIVGMLAVLKAGGAFVSLALNYPAERLAYLIADAALGVVLTHEALADNLAEHPVQTVVIGESAQEIAHQPTDNPPIPLAPEQLAYLIYTSGSTGAPKGVMISHDAIARHCVAIRERFALTPADRVLQFAALTFDQGLEQVFATLTSGATLFMRGADIWQPADFGKVVVDNALSVINLPPAYWNQVVRAWSQWQDPPQAEDLRLIIIGGDVLTPESLRIWQTTPMRSARLLNAYGPTEAIITATTHEVEPSSVDEHAALPAQTPIGRPVSPRTVQILDSKGHPAAIGTPGELHLGGVLARGYLNRPATTARSFIPDPHSPDPGARLYKTGDLVRFNADGEIEFLGRVDQQVKIRGFRIELGEIEAVLLEHPAVQDAVALSRSEVADGIAISDDKRLVAYVVVDPAQQPGAGDLYHHCKRLLPPYMVPSAFVVLDALPLTTSGKVDRRALPAPEPERPMLTGIYTAPRTPLEEELAEMWSQLLGLKRVGIYDNFFELGGHSLLATQLVSRVRESYPVDLPLRRLFQKPTIAELAALIEEQMLSQESDEDLEGLLSELEGMSDADVEKMLADL
jgi:amino acid adenylation domain-containing protein